MTYDMKNNLCLAGAAIAMSAYAETVNFDRDPVGAAPPGWTCGVTGKGSPRWTVEADPSAPSPPNVLRQSGAGTFPWCVLKGVSMENGFVEVKFKPLAGKEDQAGGVVWRWKDGDNYYVARANALEDNVSLYHTEDGQRKTIKYVDAPVARNRWHTLRAEFEGTRTSGWQTAVSPGPARSACGPRRIASRHSTTSRTARRQGEVGSRICDAARRSE
jgi:hypothetical protein